MARDPEVTYDNHAAFGSTDAKERLEAARRRAHRRRGDLHDDRLALGGRARRRRAVAGLHACLQPVDLRMVLRQRRPARARRAPLARRSRRRRRRAGPGRRRGRSRRATSRRSRTPPSRSAIPTTTSSSRRRKTTTCRSPSTRRSSRSGRRAAGWARGRTCAELRLTASVQASDGVRHQFSTLFDYGVFDRFPQLKILVLESGGGWIGYWLDRMDGVFGHTAIGQRVPLAEPALLLLQGALLHQLRSRRAVDPLARRAVRRRSVHVGVATSRTPTTRPSTSRTSTCSRACSPTRAGASSSATTAGSCSRSMPDSRRYVFPEPGETIGMVAKRRASRHR